MSVFLILLICCIQALALPDAIVNLDNASIDYAQKSHEIAGIMYYAPWCSHSQELLPIWNSLQNATAFMSVFLAKVDCVANPDLYEIEKIESFPTIKFYFYGLPIEYDGDRDLKSLTEFVENLYYDEVQDIETSNRLAAFKSSNLKPETPILLGFFPDSTKLSLHFAYLSKLNPWIKCIMSENAVMADTMAVKMNSVVLIRQFADENEVVVYEGDEDSLDQLKSWFNLYGYPLLMPLTEENKSVMFDAKRPGFSTHFIAVLDTRTIESKSHIKFLQSLAVSHAGKCLFILVDLADPNYAVDTLKDLGVDPSVYPTAVIVASRKEAVHNRKFDGQAFDAFHVEEWLNIFFTEKLSKTTNSVHKREL